MCLTVLVVGELQDLHAVGEGGVGSLGLGVVVNLVGQMTAWLPELHNHREEMDIQQTNKQPLWCSSGPGIQD